ncbi:hypothetical protein [Halomonas sp.]|uniref:hypothetical protein n=1 Tax=Halomonas sp. TaxID=1486246 RepID=UPI003564BAB2
MQKKESNDAEVHTYQNNDIVSAASGETDTKDFTVVDETHPVAQATGSTDARKRQVDNDWLNEILAEQIYDEDSAFAREFLQNSETACIRKARLLLSQHPEYGSQFLNRTVWYDAENDETITEVNNTPDRQRILAEYDIADDDLTKITLPRKIETVIDAARDIGYDPTIEVDVYHDEREIVWEDNGIGMTFKELDEAYNFTGRSGSGIEGDTGGKWGMGALTFVPLAGKKGDMDLTTKTCRPDAEDYDYEGIRVCAYLGGFNPLPGDVSDDFQGTRFEIPVLTPEKGGVSMSDLHGWVKKYAAKLKVPVAYTEHENGTKIREEEYGGVKFIDSFGEPPVAIDRPGEFTAVTGPDVKVGRLSYNDTRDDTWLVSMPISRNTKASVNSFWNVAIQIHDEQGRIISGPNRGKYRTPVEQNGGLHEDDIVLPEPTADRDRLQKDDEQEAFFEYVSQEVKSAELALVTEFTNEITAVDHPAEAIRNNPDDWKVFVRMVNFTDFVNDRDEFADWDDETAERVYEMFDEVSYASRVCHNPRNKGSRENKRLGDILADIPRENVYVGCTINEDRAKVVFNTHDTAGIIAAKKTSEYGPYQENFGFKLLNDVPMKQSDDHDFDVPEHIHNAHKRDVSPSDEAGDEVVDAIGDRKLSLRLNNRNTTIDRKVTVDETLEKLDEGRLNGKSTLVVFPRGGEHNVSDNYGLQRWAAITSVTSQEYEVMKDNPRVMTKDEFISRAENTVIATEEGGMKVKDLIEMDDRHVIIAYATKKEHKLLLSEENDSLRALLAEDMNEQPYWNTDDDGNSLRTEPLFCVADAKTLEQAAYAFAQDYPRRSDIIGLKFRYHARMEWVDHIDWESLDGDMDEYKLKADTPKWDNDSEVYGLFNRNRADDFTGSVLMGMHDIGLDPMQLDNTSIRNLVATMDDRTWNEDSEWPMNHIKTGDK